MLRIGTKATTDQKLGKENDCYAAATLEGETVVPGPLLVHFVGG